jgi:Flp pilus assembly protein TadD
MPKTAPESTRTTNVRKARRTLSERPTVETPHVDPRLEPAAGPAWWSWLTALAVAIAAFATFWRTSNFGFVNLDDNINIYENPHLNPVTAGSIPYFWTHTFQHTYRPLVYTVWTLLAACAHRKPPPIDSMSEITLDPHVFHFANAGLHAINAALCFAVLRLLVRKPWAAAAGALLWAVHPIQTEAVAWATGMNELLFGFFALLTLWSYLAFAEASRKGRRPAVCHCLYGMATVFYILALCAKPTAVILPVIVWLLDAALVRRSWRAGFSYLAPWAMVAIAWVVVTQQAKPSELALVHVSLWFRPFVAGDALAFYLYKILIPFNFCADYGRSPDYVMAHGWGYVNWLIPAALGLCLWTVRRRWPVPAVAFGVFVVALLPVLGFVTNTFQLFSTVADRYVYLPLVGPALLLAWWLARLDPKKPEGQGVGVACAVVIALLARASISTSTPWIGPHTFNTYILHINPGSWLAANNLGLASERGRDYNSAIGWYGRALAIKPDAAQPRFNLGHALKVRGDDAGAAEAYRKALSADPGRAETRTLLADTLSRLGRGAEAFEVAREALSYYPNSADAHNSMGFALTKLGRREEALVELQEAIRLRPDFAAARAIQGITLQEFGRLDEAMAAFREAIRLNPKDALSHNNLGFCLARQGQVDAAMVEWRQAIALKAGYSEALYNLAVALSLRGKKSEAIENLSSALLARRDYAPARALYRKLVGREYP